MPLTLTLNGQTRTFAGLDGEASLADLVGALELKGDRIALELNGEIVSRTGWPVARLATGDKVELVHFVGGGCPAPLLGCRSMPERSGQHPTGRRALKPVRKGDDASHGETVLR